MIKLEGSREFNPPIINVGGQTLRSAARAAPPRYRRQTLNPSVNGRLAPAFRRRNPVPPAAGSDAKSVPRAAGVIAGSDAKPKRCRRFRRQTPVSTRRCSRLTLNRVQIPSAASPFRRDAPQRASASSPVQTLNPSVNATQRANGDTGRHAEPEDNRRVEPRQSAPGSTDYDPLSGLRITEPIVTRCGASDKLRRS